MTLEVESLVDGDGSALEVLPPAEGLGVGRLLLDVIRRPSAAFRRLAEHPGRRWLWPLLAMMVLAAAEAVAVVLSPGAAAAQQAALAGQNLSPEQLAQAETMMQSGLVRGVSLGSALILAPIVAGLGLLVTAAVFHFLGTILGGQQSFGQMFTVIAWASLPVVLGLLVKLVGALTGVMSAASPGLSGLVASPGGSPSLLGPFLGQLELWTLWTLALYVLAVAAVSHVTLRKAVVAVAVYVALQLAVGLAGTMLARAVGGGFGGA
jgi:hypothetical protein